LDGVDTVNSTKAGGMLEGSAQEILDVDQRVSTEFAFALQSQPESARHPSCGNHAAARARKFALGDTSTYCDSP
jgi:hypothetical protein